MESNQSLESQRRKPSASSNATDGGCKSSSKAEQKNTIRMKERGDIMKENWKEKMYRQHSTENIKKTNQTWVVKNERGEAIKRVDYQTGKEVQAVYWGKLKDIVKLISLKEFLEMATLEVVNKGGNNRNHKPITKEEIVRLLEER